MLHESRFGRFELRRHLGRGGMGDVYLAYDPESDSQVALKLIRLSLDDPEMLEAERKGIDLQERLHPHVPEIAAVYNKGEKDGFFYLSMEYVEGLDLASVLKQGTMPERRAVGIAIQLGRIWRGSLRSLRELREHEGARGSVVHGDLKPENVRLQDGDRVRLIDFGLAKSLSVTRKFTRIVFASPEYAPPERLAQSRMDTQSDLWAVGVMLYEMVAGHRPFKGETASAMVRPEPLPPTCSPDLRRILMKCLAFDPARRYPTAAALRADLEAFQDGRPVVAEVVEADSASETRRTGPPAPKEVGGRVEERPKKERPAEKERERRQPPPSRRQSHGRFPGRWSIAVFLLLLIAASHVYAFQEGQAIRQALASSSEQDLPALYDRFRWVRWFDPAGLVLEEVRRELKTSLLRVANLPFASFRANMATTAQDWRQAGGFLEKAAQLESGDEEILAKLAFCSGQVARLEAEELSARLDPEARGRWQRAAEKLEESVRRAPEIVESYMALAEIYGNERSGSIEVKSAWCMLEEGDDPARFYTTNALYYDQDQSGQLFYKNGTFALIGIHIIHKTQNYPDFIFTTFEQVDVASADTQSSRWAMTAGRKPARRHLSSGKPARRTGRSSTRCLRRWTT